MDMVRAMHYHSQSIMIGKELENPDLIASALFRRAKTLLRREQPERAMADMTQAVTYARTARNNLRGYVYQMAGEVVTRLPRSSETTTQFHRFMDAAGKILRSGGIEDDGSGAHFNAAGFHQDRARGFLRLNDTEGALNALALADQYQPRNMPRWQVELTTLRAQAYAQSGEPEWACQQLEEAYLLLPLTQSKVQKQNIRDVYDGILARYPQEVKVRQLAPLIRG
jgi:tetratricopeptide (TPR) repeat protein